MGLSKPEDSVIKVHFLKRIYMGADIGKHILGIPIAFKDYTRETVIFNKVNEKVKGNGKLEVA